MTTSQSMVTLAVPSSAPLPWFTSGRNSHTHSSNNTETTKSASTTWNTNNHKVQGAFATSHHLLARPFPMRLPQRGVTATECKFFCGIWDSDYKATYVAHKRLLEGCQMRIQPKVSIPNVGLAYITRTQVKVNSLIPRKDWTCLNSSPLPGPFTGDWGRGRGRVGLSSTLVGQGHTIIHC